MSKRPWFKPFGLFYLPVSWPGAVCTAATLVFCVQAFIAVDRHSHSVSDTLFGIFPYVVPAFLLLNWLASRMCEAHRMISLDNKIPPPVVALVLVPITWALSHLLPRIDAPTPLRIALTVGIACTGLAFSGAGSFAFKRARTTINPLRPERASSLVITGVYRLTRNPMYVGMMLGLLSWAVYLASPLSLLGPVAFIAYITRYQIKPEERVLKAKFGAAYEQYMAEVRRWI